MSVKARLEDARVLRENGRHEGALLSVLIAVAATSRKRYPNRRKMGDRVAFTRFLADEADARRSGCTAVTEIIFNGKALLIEEWLYEFVRCELAHSAELPMDVAFESGNNYKLKVGGGKVIMSDGLIDLLCKWITEAPENADESVAQIRESEGGSQ